jgi:regulator of sigma E protease
MWQSGVMEPFEPRILSVLDSISGGSEAEKAGLKKGDKVVSINGVASPYWSDFTRAVRKNTERDIMTFEIERNGVVQTINIAPDEENVIGVYPKTPKEDILNINHKNYSFGESIGKGWSKAYWTLKDYMAQFKYVFTKKGATSLGGFITIGSIFPSTWDWQSFWSITALLSIMLGFMNLLPIPALDGGHVVFTLYEIITGRKPSDKFLEYAQVTGFIILIALLLLANGNDIYKWLTGKF